MENASKALLIAGALLIVLATITIVVSIFNSGNDIANDTSKRIDESILQYHNSQFSIYEKNNLPYSELLKLINSVDNNNKRNSEKIYNVKMELYETDSDTDLSGTYEDTTILNNPFVKKASPAKGEEFKVLLDYSENGLINLIKIYKMK